jgi:hypothetical protein
VDIPESSCIERSLTYDDDEHRPAVVFPMALEARKSLPSYRLTLSLPSAAKDMVVSGFSRNIGTS